MGKPSIFSREYEKKMKRRRRNIIIISSIILLVISAFIVKIICNPIDYKNIKNNIQAWIDSDTTNMESSAQGDKKQESNEEVNNDKVEKEAEEPQKPVEEYINITLANGGIAKAIYVDDVKSGKIFKTLDTSEKDVSYDISPSGKQIIVIDTNLVITLYNIDGTNKVVSKDQYISTSGSVFAKEAIIQSNQAYLWNVNPKFISDDKIIFVTNRPYFGGGNLKQYLWMTDTTNDTDKIFWELAGQNIEIGTKEDKGVKVTVDGQIHYIDANGNNIQ